MATIRARIDDNISLMACNVLSEIGLTASDAIRLMMTRIAKERRMPFDFFVPNAETLKAINDADKGIGLTTVNNIDELFDKLNDEND